jgi:hypothetical protein
MNRAMCFTWIKTQLHTAGLVERAKRAGRIGASARGSRAMRQDGSRHCCLEGHAPLILL